jgi:hypothetical protein
MISTFSDKSQPEAHSLFQDWRLENPDGFFLTQKGKQSYSLHHVGCHHIGSPFWDGTVAESRGSLHSSTASQKICSSNPNELLSWLANRGAAHSTCRHCVDASNPNHLKPSILANQRMEGWLEELNELSEEEGSPLQESNNWPVQEELPADTPLFEGARLIIQVNAFERNPVARRKCISHYGTSCSVCGFNFGATYGSSAENYIHTHHLKPLASIGEEYVIDPINDLRPVCANCHAVIHLRQPPYSIEEVKGMLHNDADA